MNGYVRGLLWKPTSIFELRVRLVCRETCFSPPVKYFYWLFQSGASFVDHFCFIVFVMLLRLFISALERADLLTLVCDVYCDLFYFPVWYAG